MGGRKTATKTEVRMKSQCEYSVTANKGTNTSMDKAKHGQYTRTYRRGGRKPNESNVDKRGNAKKR